MFIQTNGNSNHPNIEQNLVSKDTVDIRKCRILSSQLFKKKYRFVLQIKLEINETKIMCKKTKKVANKLIYRISNNKSSFFI